MGDLAPLLGSGSIGALLAVVIFYLLNGNRQDRAQYADLVKDAEARADAADLRRAAAEKQLDHERAERRKVEDDYAKLAREVHGLREQVERLTAQVARLRSEVGGSA